MSEPLSNGLIAAKDSDWRRARDELACTVFQLARSAMARGWEVITFLVVASAVIPLAFSIVRQAWMPDIVQGVGRPLMILAGVVFFCYARKLRHWGWQCTESDQSANALAPSDQQSDKATSPFLNNRSRWSVVFVSLAVVIIALMALSHVTWRCSIPMFDYSVPESERTTMFVPLVLPKAVYDEIVWYQMDKDKPMTPVGTRWDAARTNPHKFGEMLAEQAGMHILATATLILLLHVVIIVALSLCVTFALASPLEEGAVVEFGTADNIEIDM